MPKQPRVLRSAMSVVRLHAHWRDILEFIFAAAFLVGAIKFIAREYGAMTWDEALLTGIGMAGLLILLWLRYGPALKHLIGIGIDEADVRAQAKALASELNQFVGDRDQGDPSRRTPTSWSLPKSASEKSKREAFHHDGDVLRAYMTETASRYQMRFAARVMQLYSEIRRAGIVEFEEDEYLTFEIPMQMMFDRIALVLGMVGEGATWIPAPFTSRGRQSPKPEEFLEE